MTEASGSEPPAAAPVVAATAAPLKHHRTPEEKAAERQKDIFQAIDEGHDADIPSDLGYVLDEQGKQKRRKSIAEQRKKSLSRVQSATGRAEAPGQDVEKEAGLGAEAGAGGELPGEGEDAAVSSEDEANIVWWDGPDDPENPYNWALWVKVMNCICISLLTFITPLGSSFFAPGVPELMVDFRSSSEELAAFVVSVYVLGFAIGPLLIAPLSEIYGRLIVYHACNLGFIAFTIACAVAPSMNTLIVFRFFAGAFGSCPLTNGGGSIADMIEQEKRGFAMAAFSIGPMLGPIIGPVAGGFLASAKGWRWVFWVMAIISGALFLFMLAFARETYSPVLLQRKTERLRKETGNYMLHSKLDAGLSTEDYFKRGLVRPFKLLFRSPYCQIFAVYLGISYAYLYIMFTSVTEVFQQYYGFSTSLVGLVFLGLGIGSLMGLFWFSIMSDRMLKQHAAKEGHGMKPEYRLGPLPFGAIILPIGFFIYGWTAQYHVHWIVPIIGHLFIGIGNIITFMSVSMALVDAFNIYAASALAANTVIRSIFGAVLPLCGLKMYAALGLGWGNSLLGFIAMAMVPVSFLVIRYGEYLRTRFPVKNL